MTEEKPLELPEIPEAELDSLIKNWESHPEHLTVTLPTKEGEAAVEAALKAIRGRSYSGRNPHLGKMINCQFCGLRHRENERKCEQKFAVELAPPDGMTQLTPRQVLGAARFNRQRQRPRRRPKSPMTKWERVLVEAHKRKHAEKA